MRRLISTFLAMLALAAAMTAGLGWYAQRTVAARARDTARVLRENFDSVEAMDRVAAGLAAGDRLTLDRMAADDSATSAAGGGPGISREVEAALAGIERAMAAEEGNITLPGEAEAAARLRTALTAYRGALTALARDLESTVTAGVAPLQAATPGAIAARHGRSVAPTRDAAAAAADAIRRMNLAHLEATAATQTDAAPRNIAGGTLVAVTALLAAGANLARRLHRQARELQALRTHFVAIASHELRTPVTSLKMGVDLLAGEAVGPLNDEQRAVAEACAEDCARLLALSRQLLDATKIESGQLEMHPVAVEPGPLISDAVKALRRTMAEKRITVDLDIDLPPAVRVLVDPAKCAWVTTNLLANAARYSPADGAVRVTARLARAGRLARAEVAVSVSDTGPGIVPEVARRVFQPYFRSAYGEAAESGGAGAAGGAAGHFGLGLSIAREIVAAHGGRIFVESEPFLGRGTTVTFTLPLAADDV